MSTKTTLKRVALVAVSALGFGLMTVVPSQGAVTALSAGTSSPSRIGALSTTTVTATHAAADTSFTAAVKITAAPTGSVLRTDTNTATKGVTITSGTGAASAVNYGAGSVYATVGSSNGGTATSSTFKVGFTADVAGTYTLLVSTGNNTYTAGDASVAVTITTVGAPTTVTLASLAGKVVEGGTKGQLFSLSLKDANGNATVLGQDEGIILSEGSANVEIKGLAGSADASDSASFALGVNDSNLVSGVYYFRATDSAAVTDGTVIITATGTGLLPATLTSNVTATTVGTYVVLAAGGDLLGLTSTTGYTTVSPTLSATYGTKGSTHGFTVTLAALYLDTGVEVRSDYVVNVVTPTALSYDTSVSVAAGKLTGAFSVTQAVTSADAAALTVTFGSSPAIGISYKASAATAMALVSPTVTSILSATAATNKFTVRVTDQYSAGMANIAVSVAVSGRNTVATTVLGVTDATGYISYSLKDAGTTGAKDTLSFTGAGSGASATVNYGTVTAATVTVSGGNKAETIAGSETNMINAADNGPEASSMPIKAVVKDASGNLLAGVPVTFAVSSGAIYKTAAVDYSTVYTDSSGAATTQVFDWKVGKQTITATSGAVSGTDYLNWVATDVTSARVLTGTLSGNILTYTVVDRFGNPVEGAQINLSRTGTGLFGYGLSTLLTFTDEAGTVSANFVGEGSVKAKLPTAYVQAYDAAGEIDATAVTAAVAGTTKGTGDTLAPKGVNTVTLAVTAGADAAATAATAAADAAAEAIDAANAATDAANLAAEAADAATVAAEEARDAADAATAAVEELATQVATLMAALKAQITTLANTVAKIAKKVKA